MWIVSNPYASDCTYYALIFIVNIKRRFFIICCLQTDIYTFWINFWNHPKYCPKHHYPEPLYFLALQILFPNKKKMDVKSAWYNKLVQVCGWASAEQPVLFFCPFHSFSCRAGRTAARPAGLLYPQNRRYMFLCPTVSVIIPATDQT